MRFVTVLLNKNEHKMNTNLSPSQSFSAKGFFKFQAYEFKRVVLQAGFSPSPSCSKFPCRRCPRHSKGQLLNSRSLIFFLTRTVPI